MPDSELISLLSRIARDIEAIKHHLDRRNESTGSVVAVKQQVDGIDMTKNGSGKRLGYAAALFIRKVTGSKNFSHHHSAMVMDLYDKGYSADEIRRILKLGDRSKLSMYMDDILRAMDDGKHVVKPSKVAPMQSPET